MLTRSRSSSKNPTVDISTSSQVSAPVRTIGHKSSSANGSTHNDPFEFKVPEVPAKYRKTSSSSASRGISIPIIPSPPPPPTSSKPRSGAANDSTSSRGHSTSRKEVDPAQKVFNALSPEWRKELLKGPTPLGQVFSDDTMKAPSSNTDAFTPSKLSAKPIKTSTPSAEIPRKIEKRTSISSSPAFTSGDVAALNPEKKLFFDQFNAFSVVLRCRKDLRWFKTISLAIQTATGHAFELAHLFAIATLLPVDALELTYSPNGGVANMDVSIKATSAFFGANAKAVFFNNLQKVKLDALLQQAEVKRQAVFEKSSSQMTTNLHQQLLPAAAPFSSVMVSSSSNAINETTVSASLSRMTPVLEQARSSRLKRQQDITAADAKSLKDVPIDSKLSFMSERKKLRVRKTAVINAEAETLALNSRLARQRHLCYLPSLIDLLERDFHYRGVQRMEWEALKTRILSAHPNAAHLSSHDVDHQLHLLIEICPEYYERQKMNVAALDLAIGLSPMSMSTTNQKQDWWCFRATEWKTREDRDRILQKIRAYELAQ